MGKAIHDWDMIRENDRILVGLSGGLDSQALMNRLYAFKKKAPIQYDLFPVHIDPGFDGSFSDALVAYVKSRYGSLHVEYTDYGQVAHSERNTENPCFLCSRLRRKKLFELAKENNCKKIALGHNKDDIIETLFINIFYAGKIGTMKPRQSFFKGALDIIRPLSYVDKNDISAFCRQFRLPEFKNTCPSAGRTKRKEIKEMLEAMYQHNKHIKGNVFRAMKNVVPDYLLDQP
ncbi:MAG: tRNA 2-thiocytidine(32) synthetase TtcA [Desulfobacterales bacterium]|nr:tRNA 2-thiocytidine(32) synthetase TtcA [Desulfobacterales bacterium]